jgi:hypothetical protein
MQKEIMGDESKGFVKYNMIYAVFIDGKHPT